MERERIRNGGLYRVTHQINRRPAVNVHHATRYSDRIGLPLNRFVTINFNLTGCAQKEVAPSFRKLLAQRFAPWLRRTEGNKQHVPPTYVWTIEAASGQTAAHWLVHVPPALARTFERKLTEWLASLLGSEPEPRAVKVQLVHNLIGVRRYMLKGVDPIWAKHLGVRHVSQGVVLGKRSGFSKNLGPAARKRGGYRPRRVPPSAS